MIKALIFDCFGVLYVDYGLAFYEKHVPNYHTVHDQIMELDKQADYGLITIEEHDRQVAEISGLDYDFVHENVRGLHERNDALLEVLHELKNSYKIGMLSNVSAGGLDSFFTLSEQSEWFDEVMTSGELGMAKPSQAIFAYAAAKLGVEPEECVMVDDRLRNCEEARYAGMNAILYTTVHDCKEHLRQLGVAIDA